MMICLHDKLRCQTEAIKIIENVKGKRSLFCLDENFLPG